MPTEQGRELLRLARCDVCPLGAVLRKRGEFGPVPAEINAGATAILIGEAPGKQEDTIKIPFVGPLGADLIEMVEATGHTRDDLSWTNVVACRWPGDDPRGFHARLKKSNDKRLAEGREVLPKPETCCKPRLDAEMALHDNVITVGAAPFKAVGVRSPIDESVNHNPTLDNFRGAPCRTADDKPLIPTRLDWMRHGRWKIIVQEDLERAFRYFDDKLTWIEPAVVLRPTPDELRDFLETTDPQPLVVDVETAPYDVTESGAKLFDGQFDELRCVGIGNSQQVLVVPFLGVDGVTKFYTDAELSEILPLLYDFLIGSRTKVGHNIGYYDRMVLERAFGANPRPILDTHPLHKLADSEYSHGLAFLGSRYTDAPAWKSEHTATEAETDGELWSYNARDIAVNARVAAPVVALAKKKKQDVFYPIYLRLQDICVQMHRRGLYLDETTRAAHEARLVAEQDVHRATVVEVVGRDINPGSTTQIGAVLFDEWGLPPQELTEGGDPSTDDTSLRRLIASPLTTPRQKTLLYAVRKFRTARVLVSNYLHKWRPGGGYVDAASRLYPDFNPAGTVGWRFSSPFQSIKYGLRDCFVAPEGYTIVAADYDQLELRLAAARAGAKHYLDAFETGSIDPHNLTGQLVFRDYWSLEGAPTDKREKGTGVFKKRRDLVKRVVYASLYGANAPTVHDVITEAEDDDGNLLYVDMAVRAVRSIHSRWLAAAPEFKLWWAKQIATYRRQGYIADPVWGLRRYFADGEEFNEIVNTEIQFGGGAIVHTGMFAVEDNWKFEGLEGLFMQVHDSLAYYIKNERVQAFVACLNEHLPVRIDGIPVTFTAEVHVGDTLKL